MQETEEREQDQLELLSVSVPRQKLVKLMSDLQNLQEQAQEAWDYATEAEGYANDAESAIYESRYGAEEAKRRASDVLTGAEALSSEVNDWLVQEEERWDDR